MPKRDTEIELKYDLLHADTEECPERGHSFLLLTLGKLFCVSGVSCNDEGYLPS